MSVQHHYNIMCLPSLVVESGELKDTTISYSKSNQLPFLTVKVIKVSLVVHSNKPVQGGTLSGIALNG